MGDEKPKITPQEIGSLRLVMKEIVSNFLIGHLNRSLLWCHMVTSAGISINRLHISWSNFNKKRPLITILSVHFSLNT